MEVASTSFIESNRKEFRGFGVMGIKPFVADTLRIVDNLGVLLFRDRQNYGTLSVRNTLDGGLPLSPHRPGSLFYWRGVSIFLART
jgi:hypothetical protein